MSVAVSSKRYAQAIFEIAMKSHELDEWQNNLKKIAELMQNDEFSALMENPKLRFEKKSQLIDATLGKINPLARNLIYLLVLKNKFKNASQISDQYTSLVDEHKGIKKADVITSIPLDDLEKRSLVDRLEKLVESKLRVNFEVDINIIGGFVARIDGTLLDGSISNKLEILRNNIGQIRK